MVTYCCVYGCKNNGTMENIHFHRFPRDAKLAKQWDIALKRGKPHSKTMVVCSHHFEDKDYRPKPIFPNKDQPKYLVRLRPLAVPSANLPLRKFEKKPTKANGRNKKKLLMEEDSDCEQSVSDDSSEAGMDIDSTNKDTTILPYQFEPEASTDDENNPSHPHHEAEVVDVNESSSEEETTTTTDSSYEAAFKNYDDDDDDFFFARPTGPVLPYQFEPLASPPTAEELQAEADLKKRLKNTDWCTCGNCIPMKNAEECICCREANEIEELVEGNCITERKEFHGTCLDMHQLKLSYQEHVNEKTWKRPQEPEKGQIYRKYRYVAFRRFMRWCYWELPDSPFPVPSCVRKKIREALPSDELCGLTPYVRKTKKKKKKRIDMSKIRYS